MKEASNLTKLVIDLLTLHNCHVWRQNTIPVYDNFRKAYRANNTKKGVADVIGITPEGRFIGIEIKVGKDKQSADQMKFQAEVEKRKGIYTIIKTSEDANNFVKRYFK